ncbi:hypothetical protein ACFIOZ_14630 [Vreelandella sp. F11]|uniref:hypothetical protein n=1 Tax=Vreelandella sp. F11 TaxID=3394751 RepID=UPI0036D96A0F
MSTPINIHRYADQWFKESFNVSARSRCIFVTPDRVEAGKYTTGFDCSAIVQIKPVCDYNLVFSEKVIDMNHHLFSDDMSKSDVFAWLESQNYQLVRSISDLPKDLVSEIMIDCNGFWVIKDEEFYF